MLSSSCSSQPSKPRRFDPSRRTTTFVAPKSRGPASQREDKNMNTIASSSPRRPTKTPTVPTRSRVGLQPRAPVGQPKFSSQKQASPVTKSVRPKQRNARASATTKKAPAAAAPPLPSVLPLDPNCNEPSLPCLCCDGRSPQDNNSMFNHNHNNNNTISLRQQLQMPLPPPVLHHRQDGKGAKEQPPSPEQAQAQMELPACPAAALENEKKNANESTSLDNKKYVEVEEEDDKEESSGDIDIDDEEEEADVDDDDDDDDDDEDDDTLVPSCCDCGPSLLEFSLSSSTSSSSSTSISSCSDLESDCADQSASTCSFQDKDNLASMLSPKERSALLQPSEGQPPARLPPTLPLSTNPFIQTSHSPCSPDEGYPSALDSPSPDYLGIKDDSEVTKLGLLDFLESVGEFGKMERFSQVIQVARWDLEGEQNWDALRDRLDHLDRLEKVNREVKLAYVARLHEKGFDFGDLEEQDLSDVMDEMGNIEIPWKLYKGQGGTMGDSQEFSDAGVDLTGPSDCDEPFVPDSLTPSPIEPPPRPPKPPARHASVSSDLHTYINISREPTSMVVSTSPTLSTFSPNSSSPTFTTFKCEKPLPPSPPSIPPLPSSKPVPYLTLYTTPSPPPSLPTPTPPIPPPRRRHLARKEAQRLAALQAEQEKTPLSLPPPTTRPPPLPPPPVISVSSSPPAIPPPPPLPPPPSFHALDVEIRKLLMLAGLTQAELLKLSPELGICVGGLESDEDNVILSRSVEEDEFRLQETEGKTKSETGLMARDWKSSRNNQKLDPPEENKKEEESRDTQRTTSFSEIARRRKRNSGLCSEPYYSTGFSSIHEAKTKTVSYESFPYPAELPESPPPPPPPRPLPPIPPSLPPVKVSTLPANSAEPERFDWLIAFTPECEGPKQPPDMRKWSVKSEKKVGSMSLSPGCAPKVTTFKELRFRNKSASPPTKVISDPDPDPTVITPDPDILYNLKWRREKAGSDGSQWEYTSQAQALFMQPPPALTSMAALKEMLQRADKEGGHLELCPAPKNSCTVSDSGLWTTGRQGASDWEPEDGKEGREEKAEVAVRGEADGGRTFESRTSISSPPLSLAQSSQPYFLHSALPSYRPGHYSPQFFADPRPQSHVGRETTDEPCDRRQASAVSSADIHRDDSSPDLSSGFNSGSMVDVCVDSPFDNEKLFDTHADLTSESSCNFDSLYCSDSETQNGTKTMSDTPPDGTTGVSSGCTTPPGCTTPYKNIDVMKMYSNDISAVDSLNSGRQTRPLPDSSKARRYKALPPLPTYYLYHPKNCPLHRGAPPRLSPIGALSPPHRSGAPPPGTAGSCLSSPLFPRSHTLPALAAPLYYPNLYPPIPPSAPPLPPKLYQVPLRSRVTTVRSASFAGSVPKADTSWMGEDVRHPLRGAGLSSLCLQEKKVLVSAVSDAVEAILGQFSASRTVVQKTLSGDSTINPALGRLVLQCLCPALHSLLTDGLKPHQSDLIAGRRPNSAWGLVQASTRPGPKTQILFNLQVRVSELPQLRHSKQRFNAFLLGLLNTKFLDFWLSHLLSCTDVLETYYHPASFMRLSLTTCRPLFEELLLVLQPLSLLTFNLDLLFQHHRFEPDCHSPDIPSPPCQETGFQLRSQSKSRYIESLSAVNLGSSNPQTAGEGPSPQADPKNQAVESTDGSAEGENLPDALGHTSPQLLWVQEKEIGALPPPDLEEDSFVQQAGQVIQQGWGAVKRWGDRLSQNLAELSAKKDEVKTGLTLQVQAGSDFAPVSSDAQVPWGLGRLFGASKSPSSPQGHTPPSRRPSQWLAPGVSALTRMVSSSSAPIIRKFPGTLEETEPESDNEDGAVEIKDKARPLRSVRTLCDHAGTGSELTFCKGEELVVLGGVDQDWIRCRQGDREGLVPIGYTSLIM